MTANLAWALEPVGATVVLSPQSNKPLQRTGPAPAFVYRRFGEPAPQLNVMYVRSTNLDLRTARNVWAAPADCEFQKSLVRGAELPHRSRGLGVEKAGAGFREAPRFAEAGDEAAEIAPHSMALSHRGASAGGYLIEPLPGGLSKGGVPDPLGGGQTDPPIAVASSGVIHPITLLNSGRPN